MARYKIVKVPKIKSDPIFRIEIWQKTTINSSFFTTVSQGWVYVDVNGKAMRKGKSSWSQEVLKPFTTYEQAKEYLDAILEFIPSEIEVVFDTLSANPPKETGT